jgi:hypothetical protein
MPKFCIYNNQIATIKEALTNGGRKEITKALEELAEVQTYYAIAAISKADVAGKAFGTSDKEDLISDDIMEEIASDMGDAYLENGYWVDLDCMIEDKDIKKLDGE